MNSEEPIRFCLQEAKHEDVCEHLFECSSDFLPPLSSYVDIEKYAEKLVRLTYTFEAWSSDCLVGLVAVYLNQTSKERAFITNVSVLRTYQRRGIFNELMTRAIRQAEEFGFKRVALRVSLENVVALDLYKRLGFASMDTISSKYKFTDVDDKYKFIDMEKILLPPNSD